MSNSTRKNNRKNEPNNNIFSNVSNNTLLSNVPSVLYYVNTTDTKNNVSYRYNYPKRKCEPFIRDGNTLYLRIEPRDGTTTQERKSKLIEATPLYTDANFKTAPDGIYCWLDSDKKFGAIQVRSRFEHGTLHMQIADRMDAHSIFIAGEAIKTGNKIEYNISSGTFTKKLLEDYDYNISENDAKREAQELFEYLDLEARFTDVETFITNETLPITASELQIYKDSGYDVLLFPYHTQCVSYKPVSYNSENITTLEKYKKELLEAESLLSKLEKTKLELTNKSNNAQSASMISMIDNYIEKTNSTIITWKRIITEIENRLIKPNMFGGRKTSNCTRKHRKQSTKSKKSKKSKFN
jgi:hypothetical protein